VAKRSKNKVEHRIYSETGSALKAKERGGGVRTNKSSYFFLEDKK